MNGDFLKEILPIVLWVAFMIVSGRIKKNRQKKQVPQPTSPPRRPPRDTQPTHRAPPMPAPPAPATRRAPASQAVTAAAPPAAPRPRRVVPGGLALVLDTSLAGTPLDIGIGAEIRRSAGRLRDPFQVLGWVDQITEDAIERFEDISSQLNTAAEQVDGVGEFNASTIEEFIALSPRLATTWSRQILADAFGLALLGPGFANLRESIERQRANRDVVSLAMQGDAGAGQMPYTVRLGVLRAAIKTLSMEAGWPGPSSWDPPEELISFDLGGLQRIPVPAEPMVQSSLLILRQMLRARYPTLDGRDLIEHYKRHPWNRQGPQQLKLALAVGSGANVAINAQDLLPVFMHLRASNPEADWEPRLLALASVERERASRSRKALHEASRQSPRRILIEGLLLTEILGEDMGRPLSRGRAGGR